MKKIEKLFLSEKFINILAITAVSTGIISLILLFCYHEIVLLTIFDELVKVVLTILTIRSFSRLHWDTTESMMGGLLFSLLYQEGFVVLGQLWGQTSEFDTFLIMGVQGSLYLAAQSMGFLMTIIIIINHFVIDYSHINNDFNVMFSQICIVFKVFLYIFLMIVNVFLEETALTQIYSGFEYFSDLCIIILVVSIDTQLDNFRDTKHELYQRLRERKNNG